MFKSVLKSAIVLIMIAVFVMPASIFAQDDDRSLSETLQMLSEDAAKSYLKPVSSAFGADLNAGWFHRAPKAKKLGFDLEVGFVAMGAMYPDDATSFSTSGNFVFNQKEAIGLIMNDPNTTVTYNQLNAAQQAVVDELTTTSTSVGISGATIVGAKDDYITIDFEEKSYNTPYGTVNIPTQDIVLPIAGFKELADAGVMPLMAPQLSLGTVFGTQVTLRYLPSVELDADLGEFSYFGFGIQHNPGLWFPNPLPFDVAASFYTQTLKVGDLFNTTTTAFGVNASKQLGFGFLNITPYAGFMLESANMEVTYDFIVDTPTGPQTTAIKFDLEGENTSRITLGVSIRLLLLNLNADYNIGKYNSFSAGLNVAI